MINIDPYIQKLDALKKYLFFKIEVSPLLAYDDVFEIYRETGVNVWTLFMLQTPARLPFEDWYNMRKSQPETDKP